MPGLDTERGPHDVRRPILRAPAAREPPPRLEAARLPRRRARTVDGGGKGGASAIGSATWRWGYSSGATHGSESSGNRKPMGESPGVRKRCPERKNQTPLVQCAAESASSNPLQRQHVSDDFAEPTLEDRREPRALLFVLELRP